MAIWQQEEKETNPGHTSMVCRLLCSTYSFANYEAIKRSMFTKLWGGESVSKAPQTVQYTKQNTVTQIDHATQVEIMHGDYSDLTQSILQLCICFILQLLVIGKTGHCAWH